MGRKIFVSGIGTGVGKTVVSALLAEALQADYWKPVQAGDLDRSDSARVAELLSNGRSRVHAESYRLLHPLAPQAAAELEGLSIERASFHAPAPREGASLIIEGAGGLLVPLAVGFSMIDLIADLGCSVVLVSRNYLGSINHSLLSIEALRARGIPLAGIVFNGPSTPFSEACICEHAGQAALFKLPDMPLVDKSAVLAQARRFRAEHSGRAAPDNPWLAA